MCEVNKLQKPPWCRQVLLGSLNIVLSLMRWWLSIWGTLVTFGIYFYGIFTLMMNIKWDIALYLLMFVCLVCFIKLHFMDVVILVFFLYRETMMSNGVSTIKMKLKYTSTPDDIEEFIVSWMNHICQSLKVSLYLGRKGTLECNY